MEGSIATKSSPGDEGFRSLPIESQYLCRADRILRELVAPVLERSIAYDRITSYFDVSSLSAVAFGIETLWKRGGKMRLVIGIHDVPPELLQAYLGTENWPDEVFRALRERLLAEASTVRDEFRRNRLATLAWMLKDGLLTVKVAILLDAKGQPARSGVFHPKHLLFTSAKDGDRIAAVGSPNETVPGQSSNVEDLLVLRSWLAGQEGLVTGQFTQFDNVWNGMSVDFTVRSIDSEFANLLLDSIHMPREPLGRIPIPQVLSMAGRVLSAGLSSPAFAMVSMGSVGLYPHQELAFLDALGRWPVRALLADEVGLGKTLEAGAVMSYLHLFGNVERIVMLVPASLLVQWQEELWSRFGLCAWRYESVEHVFVDPEERSWRLPADESPVGPKAPNIVLISSQLARGSKNSPPMFRPEDPAPDLLVLDEAHHARVSQDVSGGKRPTLLWKLMNDVVGRIPHIVLVTATPMQLHWTEYKSTLELLGLPSEWASDESFDNSLQILAGPEDKPQMDEVQWVARAVRSSIKGFHVQGSILSQDENSRAQSLVSPAKGEELSSLIDARNAWPETYAILTKLHPAHLLTIRRTRRALERLGYVFPKRELKAPPIAASEDVVRFYRAVHEYLARTYGATERTANPESYRGQGFAKIIYHQRLVSSLHAASVSLHRRRSWMTVIIDACEKPRPPPLPPGIAASDEDDEEDEPGILARIARMSNADRDRVKAMAAMERADIEHLENLLAHVHGGDLAGDPKLAEMIRIIQRHISTDRILVFSRYTDTVSACIETFRRSFPLGATPGIGTYTGEEHWLDRGRGEFPASKQEIKQALDDGIVAIVFCSDAASEGLNLQAARVLINVDVPWNPARLEQRIGRVDRLGQQADQVVIYNLWYPDSVEAKMYGRLMERHDLYELAVGEAPDVVADEIQAQVGGTLGIAEDLTRPDPLEVLQGLREDIQRRALIQIWNRRLNDRPLTAQFREDMLKLLLDVALAKNLPHETLANGNFAFRIRDEPVEVSSHLGDDHCLSLRHPIIQPLLGSGDQVPPGATAQVGQLGILRNGNHPLLFVVELAGTTWALPPPMLPAILRAVLLGTTMPITGSIQLTRDLDGGLDSKQIPGIVRKLAGWLPDVDALETIGPGKPAPPSMGHFDAVARWNVEPLGQVGILTP